MSKEASRKGKARFGWSVRRRNLLIALCFLDEAHLPSSFLTTDLSEFFQDVGRQRDCRGTQE
jgi:hypothetical protein